MSTQIINLKRSLSSILIEIIIAIFRKRTKKKGPQDLIDLIENRYKNGLEPVAINDYKFTSSIEEKSYLNMQMFIINDKKNKDQKNILYIHGGGWTLQPLSVHWKFLNKLAEKTNSKITTPIYPKTPKGYKETYSRLIRLYKTLLNNTDHEKIIIMGDSCGGNIILGLLLMIKENNLPQPKNAIVLSPCTDMNFDTPEMHEAEKKDPLLIIERALIPVKYWRENASLNNPLLSPIYGDFQNTTDIISFIGTHDLLYPSALRFDKVLESQEADITTYIYPIPEAKDVINKIVDIIYSN